MKLSVKLLAVLAGLSFLHPAVGQDFEIEDLRIPLEHFEDGTVKTEVTATSARIGETGSVIARGLEVRMRNAEGEVVTTITATDCVLDRESRKASSDKRVDVVQKGFRVSGTGFKWNASEEIIHFESDVTVEFDRELIGFNFSMLKR